MTAIFYPGKDCGTRLVGFEWPVFQKKIQEADAFFNHSDVIFGQHPGLLKLVDLLAITSTMAIFSDTQLPVYY